MTEREILRGQVEASLQRFNKTASVFEEEHAEFRPRPGLFCVREQVAHAADSVDWFARGAFGDGWDMDFAAHEAKVRGTASLGQARDWMQRAHQDFLDQLDQLTSEQLESPVPNDKILGNRPRWTVVEAVSDHTAHHRGALAVYARLLGLQPPMPYA